MSNINLENKLWTQSHRNKMASKLLHHFTSKVKKVYKDKLDKEQKIAEKMYLKHIKKITNLIKGYVNETEDTNIKDYDLKNLDDHLRPMGKFRCPVNEFISNLGIKETEYGWYERDIAGDATIMLESKVLVLRQAAYLTLEFLRTGHINDWVDLINFTRDSTHTNKEILETIKEVK